MIQEIIIQHAHPENRDEYINALPLALYSASPLTQLHVLDRGLRDSIPDRSTRMLQIGKNFGGAT